VKPFTQRVVIWSLIAVVGLSAAFWPRLSTRLTQGVLTTIEHRLNVKAALGAWHLDPLQHAVVFHDIRLENDQGPVLTVKTLHVQLDGLFQGGAIIPRYRLDLQKPFVKISRNAEGTFQLGAMTLPPERHEEHPFPLPESLTMSEGEIRLIETRDEAPLQTEFKGLNGHFKGNQGSGKMALTLQGSDALHARYDFRVERSSTHAPVTMALSLIRGILRP